MLIKHIEIESLLVQPSVIKLHHHLIIENTSPPGHRSKVLPLSTFSSFLLSTMVWSTAVTAVFSLLLVAASHAFQSGTTHFHRRCGASDGWPDAPPRHHAVLLLLLPSSPRNPFGNIILTRVCCSSRLAFPHHRLRLDALRATASRRRRRRRRLRWPA